MASAWPESPRMPEFSNSKWKRKEEEKLTAVWVMANLGNHDEVESGVAIGK